MKADRNEKPDRRIWIAAGVFIVIIIAIAVAAILTMSISPDEPGTIGIGYPYTTTFNVSLPEGQTVRVGDMDILALQTSDHIALKIGEKHEEMQKGKIREITDRTATVWVFGQPVFQTGYRIEATWTGIKNNEVLFKITLQTSRQVPDWLISRILPADINAFPE